MVGLSQKVREGNHLIPRCAQISPNWAATAAAELCRAVDREDQSHVVGRLGRLEGSLKGPKLSKQTGSAKQELTCQHTQQVEKEPQMDVVMEH